jgi:hypothetical protein
VSERSEDIPVHQHARPEISMDVDRSADDLSGNPIGVEFP